MKIQLDSSILEVLDRFRKIDNSIIFREGKMIDCFNRSYGIAANYVNQEVISESFGIYDLGKFITALSLNNEWSIDLLKDKLEVSFKNTNEVIQYGTSSVSLLNKKYDHEKIWKKINGVSDYHYQVLFSNDLIKKWINFSNTFNCNKIRFNIANDKLKVTVFNENLGKVGYDLLKEEHPIQEVTKEIDCSITIESLRMIPSKKETSYQFEFSDNLIRIKQLNLPLMFYIAAK